MSVGAFGVIEVCDGFPEKFVVVAREPREPNAVGGGEEGLGASARTLLSGDAFGIASNSRKARSHSAGPWRLSVPRMRLREK